MIDRLIDQFSLETGLKAVEINGQSFFSHGIVDPRFKQCPNNLFGPEASIVEDAPIEIILPPLRGKSCYLIQKMTLIVDVRLLTSNDGQIDKTDEVAVANNFINTMWKCSQVTLNNVNVNTNEDHHYYKVFITNQSINRLID